jgi:SecD/SecF fusion protein
MRNLALRTVITVSLILLALWAVLPHWIPGLPRIGKLALGKDLAGGVSLVYAVDIKPGEPARETLGKVIEVLKERIDPTGQLEISIVAQGNDRIEITMPLPTPRVKQLRKEFEDALAALGAGWVSPDEFERILRLPEAERSAHLDRMAAGDAARRELLAAAAAAADAAAAARAAYDEQEARVESMKEQIRALEALPDEQRNEQLLAALREGLEAEEEALYGPAGQVAAANKAYAQARDAALGAAISPAEVQRALRLSDQPLRLKDRRTNKLVELPSPRSRALQRLRESYPGAREALDRVLAAWEQYESNRSTLDDPADLKRMVRGAGVLNFRITVNPGSLPEEQQLRERLREVGPRNASSSQAGWYKINKVDNWVRDVSDLDFLAQDPAGYFRAMGYVVEEYDGEYWMLAYRAPGMALTEDDGEWGLASAIQGTDEIGRPAINFTMDALGGQKLGRLTEKNINNRMAVLLDDEVYTAPTLRGRISTSGQISGSFTMEEINYIIRVLSAGSLQAKLFPEPLSESTLAPELGQDNLDRALQAGVICFLICAAFLAGYYFNLGLIAVIGLIVNVLLLVGTMSLQHAPFSVPGIAGVILAFAMAVDANVLVYERMREEMQRGEDLRSAVRLGYQKALSAIVDGNLTNLIVAAVLGLFGTQEIKGFAIAMSVGVLTTLFAQLVVTRLIFDVLVEKLGWRRASMLPMAVPAVQRAFALNVDWMRLRPIFYVISAGLIAMSLVVIVVRGTDMLDNEFRGGTAVTIQLKTDEQGQQVKMKRVDVQNRIVEYANAAPENSSVRELAKADVLAVNPDADNVTSSRFTIKTVLTDQEVVQGAIVEAFKDVVDSQPQLQFAGADVSDARVAPIYPVLTPALGDNIDRPAVRNAVGEYVGGVVVLMENIEPPVPLASLESRLTHVRNSPDFVDAVARTSTVVVLEGSPEAVRSAAVLVRDPQISYFADEERWADDLRDREWEITRTALTQNVDLASVQSFSAAIARDFAFWAVFSVCLAVFLIVIYVGVRFNSFRFSMAGIVATAHDVLIAVGLIALAELLYDNMPGVAHPLGILPFAIDLQMVAALLTILGYSINDKIVILDRIRENRGKHTRVTRQMVNDSINQTLSRTIMTGTTTIASTLVLYLIGGEGIRGFAYALGLGIVVGTYSSIAIGAPLVLGSRDQVAPPEPDSATGAGLAAEGAAANGVPSAAAPASR